jgi:SNF2 family DNA or RNA helicase
MTENTQATMPTAQELRDKLVSELELEHLTNEEQARVISELSTIILDRLTIALISKLPEDIITHVDTLLESGQTDAVTAIIQKHVKNIEEISNAVIYDTVAQFKAMSEQQPQ